MNARQPPGHVMHGHLAVIAQPRMVDHRRVFHAQFLNRPFVHLGGRGTQAWHCSQPFGARGQTNHLCREVGGVFQHVLQDRPQLGAAMGHEGLPFGQCFGQFRIAQLDTVAPGNRCEDIARVNAGPPDRQPTCAARAQGRLRHGPDIAVGAVLVGIDRPAAVHDLHRGGTHRWRITRRAALHRHVITVSVAFPFEMHAVVVQRDA